MINSKECAVKECIRTDKFCKGYCGRHYNQIYQYGKILTDTKYDRRYAVIEGEVAKIPLGAGAKHGYAIVDAADIWVDKYSWYKSNFGYAHHKSEKVTLMHRLIMDAPENTFVDHINGDRLDNRKSNLRLVTFADNILNQKKRSDNTSGYKGVMFRKDTQRFSAGIWYREKHFSLGCFDTVEEAAIAYDCAAIQLHGEYARLNILDT